jgi:hypothetical protein
LADFRDHAAFSVLHRLPLPRHHQPAGRDRSGVEPGHRCPAQEDQEEQDRDSPAKADIARWVVDRNFLARRERQRGQVRRMVTDDDTIHQSFFPPATTRVAGTGGAIWRNTSSRGPKIFSRPSGSQAICRRSAALSGARRSRSSIRAASIPPTFWELLVALRIEVRLGLSRMIFGVSEQCPGERYALPWPADSPFPPSPSMWP